MRYPALTDAVGLAKGALAGPRTGLNTVTLRITTFKYPAATNVADLRTR